MTRVHETPVSGASYEHARFVELRLDGTLQGTRFDDCVFERCDLRELRLSGCRLVDCDLVDCDLALADVEDTTFGGVVLDGCNTVGIDWSRARVDDMRPLVLDVKGGDLGLCTFTGLRLSGRRYEGCTIHEALFERCDLRGASFRGSDLHGTVFRECDLRGADLRTARRYAIDVRVNRVEGLRVRLPDAAALLGGLEIDLS